MWSRRLRPKPQLSPVRTPRIRQLAAVLLAALALVLLGRAILPDRPPAQPPVGLFTSLPIVWAEADDLRGQLIKDHPPHRIYAALSRLGPVAALDTLDGLGPKLQRLVIAQPRALSPTENVALDNWVRAGGQVLLLADPLLTAGSIYQLGDPRRPQDIVMLSPILQRWGLELTFDEQQPGGQRKIAVSGPAIPVDLAGTWRNAAGTCQIEAEGVLATCEIGRGRVVALADADVLADTDPALLRGPAFAGLLDRAFTAH